MLCCLLFLDKLKRFIERFEELRSDVEEDTLSDKARNSIRALYLIFFLVPSVHRLDGVYESSSLSHLDKNGFFESG